MKHIVLAIVLCILASGAVLDAQRGRGGGAPPRTPRQVAPIDLTGYWVSPIIEDWKFRMVTPNKGVFPGIPLNAEGRKVGMSWDPAADEKAGEQCRAYGAAGIMRLPTRLHITWQDDSTLKIDSDYGSQTRLFHFGGAPPANGDRTWQGYTIANWESPSHGPNLP